jgi:hypothetical protein
LIHGEKQFQVPLDVGILALGTRGIHNLMEISRVHVAILILDSKEKLVVIAFRFARFGKRRKGHNLRFSSALGIGIKIERDTRFCFVLAATTTPDLQWFRYQDCSEQGAQR